MEAATARPAAPASPQEAAEALRGCSAEGVPVEIVGGATKRSWGRPVAAPGLELRTARLDAVVEHNRGDLTAVVQTGVRLHALQEALSEAGQMLALDPPLGAGDGATIGGVVATADSGPLRHRYGGPRDLVLGLTVALSDGTVARAGGKVIKNVAGYDLAKLFCGSFGTLGLIAQVALRLHPRPPATATIVARTGRPEVLAEAAEQLARAPLEPLSLDVRWRGGEGAVLARFGGAAAADQARAARESLAPVAVDPELEDDDEDAWRAQRDGQRSADGVVVRVSGLPTRLAAACAAADRAGAGLVGRAALGLWWVALPPAEPAAAAAAVAALRAELAPAPAAVLDAPPAVRAVLDPWDHPESPALALMRRVKARFDPTATCNPGRYVGGI